jgi:chemotaxis protein methyltransferase CheR
VTHQYEYNDVHFEKFKKLVAINAGISLSDAKRELVYGRLARRLRKLQIDNFDDYYDLLESDTGDELVNFVNSITTNLTSFFREEYHFEYLANTVLPELIKKNAASKKIRIWSAGCSTGEEPHSIAMTVRETIPEHANWDIKILATDIDSEVLSKAASGIYTEERTSGISAPRLKKWFQRNKGEYQNNLKIKPELQELITFRQLNLMKKLPITGQIDVLFCRNVVIYFNKDTQRELFEKYANVMPMGAHLFIGHSESLFKVSERFALLGKTIYQKTA